MSCICGDCPWISRFSLHAERRVITLHEGWEFTKGSPDAKAKWNKVRVPHDWAIYGPFDRNNDLQTWLL